MVAATPEGSLHRYFSGITEHTFQVELGIADPPLTDYLARMLARFLHMDAIFRIRDAVGRRLKSVADMLAEAEKRCSRPRTEVHQHIGDFTLFWTGLYPEMLTRLRSIDNRDFIIDYTEQGKRSYFIASRGELDPDEAQAEVLRRLSEEFELCRTGLQHVRQEFELLSLENQQSLGDATSPDDTDTNV